MQGTPQCDHRDFALGKHMTVEFYDCDSEFLADEKKMEKAFLEAARVSKATVLGTNFHSFEPQGVSGFIIIAESHFSVHSGLNTIMPQWIFSPAATGLISKQRWIP